MEDLSLHILDVVENSIAAHASKIDVRITEDQRRDRLVIVIRDNGKGMEEGVRKRALEPFFTTKVGKKTGLGLPLLAQAAEESGGSLKLESDVDRGAKVTVYFRLGHIDRKPLGDMKETMRLLRVTHPHIRFTYRHRVLG